MINFDNIMKFKSISEKIALLVKDVESQSNHQLPEKIFQLLDMLVHMQSLSVAIRTELIEKLIPICPDLPHKIKSQQKNGAELIVLYDRRKVNPDRRKIHTFLANDRRSGITDRRKGTQEIKAEIRSRRE